MPAPAAFTFPLARPSSPRMVGLTSLKGGVGRTTAAVYLSAALARRGLTVELWDADPFADALTWAADAAADADPLPLAVRPAPHVSLGAPFRWDQIPQPTPGTDVVLVDTGPGEAGLQTALKYPLDIAIVPTLPSRLDVSSLWRTVGRLPAHLPHVALLNRADPRRRATADVLGALDDEGVPSLAAVIPERQSYALAAACTPDDLGPWAQAAVDLHAHLVPGARSSSRTVACQIPGDLHAHLEERSALTGLSVKQLMLQALESTYTPAP